MRSEWRERLFLTGMWWRIGYGVLRILFGVALLKVVGAPLLDVVTSLLNYELTEDPSDILYRVISSILTEHPFYVSYFLAGYFIFWGVIDVVLSYNLIKHKTWAFPVSMVLIVLFILYGSIRFCYTHSLVLLSVLVVDAIILWLIWKEYVSLKEDATRTTPSTNLSI
ncbi:DUF2127 domain-containing protein [Candidatus Nomurabacteria bacterium]|nr:DUF2127 domain-containing protein [Candidatus Nomurabacteria bacterium]